MLQQQCDTRTFPATVRLSNFALLFLLLLTCGGGASALSYTNEYAVEVLNADDPNQVAADNGCVNDGKTTKLSPFQMNE